MAQDNPNVIELVQTVREFIEDITAKLDGQDRYHALCSGFLLKIVERELSTEWQPSETADDRRLKALLGQEIPKAEILSSLSQVIRDGGFKDRESELFDTLLQHVEAKITVTKPSYIDQFK